MLKEFKEFAMKGNLVDMAVAFVMGAAFSKLVTSFIDGIVMPMVGLFTAGVNFTSLKYILRDAVTDSVGKVVSPEVAIEYGMFITTIIDFTLVAFVMFLLVKGINSAKRKKEETAPPPAPAEEVVLLREIRDLMSKQ